MKRLFVKPVFLAVLFFITVNLTSCIAEKDYILLSRYANDPLMKGLQDNDQDLSQIEDGTNIAGEATTCPT